MMHYFRDSIQVSTAILAQNLKSITDHLATHSELFDKTVVYPSTNFPGRTQEDLLGQLLRKKLEPSVESWVDEGRRLYVETSLHDEDESEDLWKFAKDFILPRIVAAHKTNQNENYTAEEVKMGIENVDTGLKVPPKLRNKDEYADSDDEEDEDEDEDEEMEDEKADADGSKEEPPLTGSPRSLEEIIRFMTAGLTPEQDQQQLQQNGMSMGIRR